MADSVREMMRAKQREKERKAAELAAALKSSKNKEQVRGSVRVRVCVIRGLWMDVLAHHRHYHQPNPNSCWP